MNYFEFKITKESGRARIAEFITSHGNVITPMFMPVGTQATVKGLTPAEIKEVGSQIILANTYHLMLRPGSEIVKQFGGLHGFSAYDGPFLTDSGGFQVMSLGHLRTVSEEGVKFKSHIDGKEIHLTPEKSILIQEDLGANIIMAFDECPPYPADKEYIKNSLNRTIRWLERCFNVKTRQDQALFPIIQGGVFEDLRQLSLDLTLSFDAKGYAIGGLAVGESKEELFSSVAFTAEKLPSNKPRYLMGVGHPEDLVCGIALGVDMFDCVYPTRTGRFGYALTDNGRLNLNSSAMKLDARSIDENCDCYACKNYTRAYLSHLLRAKEMLAPRIISLHNIRYLHRLVERIRIAIIEDRFYEWAIDWGKNYFGTLPQWYQEALEISRN